MEPKTSKKREAFLVGLVQMACGEDPRKNVIFAEQEVRAAAKLGAEIICLPELFATRYFCQEENPQHFDFAENLGGTTIARFNALSAELEVVIAVPIFERRAAGIYHNSAVVLDGSREALGVYRKMHIPDDPRYYEKYYFSPGDLGYKVFDTPFARVGVLICWDQWYPEAARLMALSGAELILFPTAIGWVPEDRNDAGKQQLEAWTVVQQSHAIANGLFVATVNRVGVETRGTSDTDGIEFWGNSFVSDPSGRLLARANTERSETIVVSCDRTAIEDSRRNWPFLRDRRIDSYQNLTKLFVD